MNFCGNCGRELKQGEAFCANCGKPVNVQVNNIQMNQPTNGYYMQPNKPLGNGISIAGMILGIIAAVFALILLLGIGEADIEASVWEIAFEYDVKPTGFHGFFFGLGFCIISWLPATVGLPLSISGFRKQRTGKNIAGIVLNSCAITASLGMIVYIMTLF